MDNHAWLSASAGLGVVLFDGTYYLLQGRSAQHWAAVESQWALAVCRAAPDLKLQVPEGPPFPTLLPQLHLSWRSDQAVVALLLAVDSRLSSSARNRHFKTAAEMLGDRAVRVESSNRLLGLTLPSIAVSSVPLDTSSAGEVLWEWFEMQPAIHIALKAWSVASSYAQQKADQAPSIFAELISTGMFANVVRNLSAGAAPLINELRLHRFPAAEPALNAWCSLLNPRHSPKEWIAFLNSYFDSLRDIESLTRNLPAGLVRWLLAVATEVPWPRAQRMELTWLIDACVGAMSDDWFTQLTNSRTMLSEHEMAATLSACWRAMSLRGDRLSSPWVVLGFDPSRVFSTGDLAGEGAIKFRAEPIKIVPINAWDPAAIRTASLLDSVARQCSQRRNRA
jgi:hypothetical protein